MSEQVPPGGAGTVPPPPQAAQAAGAAARQRFGWTVAGAFGAGLVVGVVAGIITVATGTLGIGRGLIGLTFMGLYNPLLTLLLIGLAVVVIWFVVSPSGGGGRTAPARNGAALQILRERFARGEIDADEYAHRAEVLRRG